MQTLIVADQSLEMSRQLAYKLCSTQMVPKIYQMAGKNSDQAQLAAESGAVAIMWGCEIGLQPLQALQNVAVINGNPTLWGDALVAIVKGSGQCEVLTTHYDNETQTATCTTQRKGEPEETRTFSWAEAEKAGLTTKKESIYQKYAKRMLMARARSYVLRDVYADLLKGFEVREVVQEDQQNREKDITPPVKSDAIDKLLAHKNDTPKKQSESKTPERPTVKPTNNKNAKVDPENVNVEDSEKPTADTAESLKIFNDYIGGIEVAKHEELVPLGVQIREDERLSLDQTRLLRDAWHLRMAEFKPEIDAESTPTNAESR